MKKLVGKWFLPSVGASPRRLVLDALIRRLQFAISSSPSPISNPRPASPRVNILSPAHRIAPPHAGITFPTCRTANPHVGTQSQTRRAATLRVGIRIPTHRIASPHMGIPSPTGRTASPHVGTHGPTHGTAFPHTGTTSPTRRTASPHAVELNLIRLNDFIPNLKQKQRPSAALGFLPQPLDVRETHKYKTNAR